MSKKATKHVSTKPKDTKPKNVKPKVTKSLLPKSHDKNGKKLTTIQRMNAVGLRNNGRSNISQKEKMKKISQTYKQYGSGFISPENFLSSELNERLPRGF